MWSVGPQVRLVLVQRMQPVVYEQLIILYSFDMPIGVIKLTHFPVFKALL